jgi:hypothetical protein
MIADVGATGSRASAVVTTAGLTGLVELRDEGSSAPNVRHRRDDRSPSTSTEPTSPASDRASADEELSRGCEVVNHDADVIHPLESHALDGRNDGLSYASSSAVQRDSAARPCVDC